MNDPEVAADPFAHLKQRAAERSDRTVERLRAGIAALRAADQKITAESLKQVTRELEPGFAGPQLPGDPPEPTRLRTLPRSRRRLQRTADTDRTATREATAAALEAPSLTPRSSYDPLQRLDKRDLVQRIRNLERELDIDRRLRGALAYDQQVALSKILRLETELLLMNAERSHPD